VQNKPSDKSSKRPKKASATPFKKTERKKSPAIKKATGESVTEKPFDKFDKSKGKTGGIPYKKKEHKKYTEATSAANRMVKRAAEDRQLKKDAPKKDTRKKAVREEEEEDEIYTTEEKFSDETRLNKYLSHAGVASRRKADQLIKEGKVTVNGNVVTEMGYKVKAKDTVTFEGKKLNPERKYYILLNKPKDFITTVNDERDRKTVMDLLRGAYLQMKEKTKPRMYPVGRLDRNTTGVLLITNDGELAQKLTHPSSEIKKVYHVVLNKKLRKEDFDKIAEGGVVLEDGIAEVNEVAYPNPNNKAEVGVEIHTGKNRFVRRLFEALEYEVEKLDRVYFAGLTKKDIARGRWRFLSEDEVRNLKHFIH